MNCPCLEYPRAYPTAAQIDAAFRANRRAGYVADAAKAILAGRSWPIGHKFGFPDVAARNAYEKAQAEIVRRECGEAAVDELRVAVKNPSHQPPPAGGRLDGVVGPLN